MGTALALALGALGFGASEPPLARAATATIVSAGPLTAIGISSDLNCSVNHVDDTLGEFFDAIACGTLVAVGGTLYGPASIPAGGGASPRTAFTPVSQSAVLGSGTSGDPYVIVTVVDLGTSNIRLTETDSYVVGQESYRTDVELSNAGTSAQTAILYRAGDCFLQDSDFGLGSVDAGTGAVACVSSTSGRIEQWFPLSSGSRYYESTYLNVWAAIGSKAAFADSCDCATIEDNAAGLSWSVDVAAGSSQTRSQVTTFSPLGVSPLTTTKTADASTSEVGSGNGYTITVHNPNASAVTLTSITDSLPAGFTYVAGSTTGASTADPTINGQDLTWSGSFPIAANDTTSLHFNVTVAGTAGDYDNSAGATSDTVAVAGTGPTARITVTDSSTESLTTTKTADEPTSTSGGGNGYTITIHNPNTMSVSLTSITDTLPAGFSYVAGSTTGATTTDPGQVGQVLTWSGPFAVPAGGDTSLSFKVLVATAADDYYNEAGATSEEADVTGTGPTAKIVVTETPPNPPPSVDAGGPYSGNERTAVNLDGTVTNDPAGDTLTTAWTYAPDAGVPAGASCSFGSASSVDTTVTCTDDGTYTLTLTADDGVNPPVSNDATLTLANIDGTLGNGHLWLGLKSSDDQGTQFDLKVELIRGGNTIASGLTQCVTGLTRSASLAKLVGVPWGSGPLTTQPLDIVRISARIGTNANGGKCSGPGGSHSSAVGLRLYYDASGRASYFGVGISAGGNLYLHSNGGLCDKPSATRESQGVTWRLLNPTDPTALAARCKDSGAVTFSSGNHFVVVGDWTVPSPP